MKRTAPAVVDPDAAPWWEGTEIGELRYQRCENCKAVVFYPRSLCPSCFSTSLSWHASAGMATVYAHTTVHRGPDREMSGETYVVALVDVDEGFRMLTRIVDSSAGQLHIGQRVQLVFHRSSTGRNLPFFTSRF